MGGAYHSPDILIDGEYSRCHSGVLQPKVGNNSVWGAWEGGIGACAYLHVMVLGLA